MNRSLSTFNKDLSPWSIFRDDLWDVFDRFAKEFEMPTLTGTEEFSPSIEVKDTGKSYLVKAEVPGMEKKDINVTLKDNHLVIEGEKKNEMKEEDQKKGYFRSEISYGRFYRAIPFSDDVDADKVKAHYKSGVLTIELEKLPEKAGKNKKIPISVGKEDAVKTEIKH